MITTSGRSRFLIIQTAFIGDVILATALVEQLRAMYPDVLIDFLLRKGNESLLAGHPHLNEVLVWNKKQKYRSLYQLLQLIRQRRYDGILNLQRFGATGLLTALSGAAITVGFDKNPFARFFTYLVPHVMEPGVHEVDRNAGLLMYFTERRPDSVKPRLYPSTADYAAIQTYQSVPYLCIAPTSVWFTKQYPREKWVELIQQVPALYTVYLLGAPTDVTTCNWIRDQSGRTNVINLAGKLPLLQSAALLAGATMNYVNDSAPLHLCSAMNAPTTAIFCSTVPEFGFGPLADNARVVETPEPLTCRPCNLHGRAACPLGHFLCAYGIGVEQLSNGL